MLVRSFHNEKRQSGENVTGDIVLPVLMVSFEEVSFSIISGFLLTLIFLYILAHFTQRER